MLHRFDTSNHVKKLYDMPITKSVAGKMEDDYVGFFYGTAAKSYCVQTKTRNIMKAKRIGNKVEKKFSTPKTSVVNDDLNDIGNE